MERNLKHETQDGGLIQEEPSSVCFEFQLINQDGSGQGTPYWQQQIYSETNSKEAS